MAPAHLPSELLSEIFLILRDADKPEEVWEWHEDGFAADWIPVTWVCRNWRDAALQRRTLWTVFTTRHLVAHPDAIPAFLGRAPSSSPLHITVSMEKSEGGEELVDAFEHLRPWAQRVEFLSFWMNSERQAPVVGRFLRTLGPALTTLALGVHHCKGAHPLNLTRLPGLRTLYLRWVPVGNIRLRKIQTLYIENVFGGRPGVLHDFLAACPRVQWLDIRDALQPRLVLDDPAEYPVIRLPHLRHLTLRREPPDAARFTLSTFRLPRNASLDLGTLLFRPSRSREVLERDSWLRGCFPEDLETTVPLLLDTRYLRVRMDDGSSEHDGRDPGALTFGLYGTAGNAATRPYWSFDGAYSGGVPTVAGHRHFQWFLLDLPRIVRAGLLTQLELHLADWLPLRRQSLWRELFSQLPALQELVLGGWECVEAATRTLESDLTLLPALDKVGVCVSDIPERPGAERAMLRWLKARQEVGNGIEKLVGLLAFGDVSRTDTGELAERVLSDAGREVPGLETGVAAAGVECLACGWEAANRERKGGARAAVSGEEDEWEWDAPTDADPDEEEADSEDGDDGQFWTSESDSAESE